MECSDDKRCSTVRELKEKIKTLFDEEHGVFAKINNLENCLKEIKWKKVGWKSLVLLLAFVIGTFGVNWYRTSTYADDVPDNTKNIKVVLDKVTDIEKDNIKLEKDITHNSEQINKLIVLAENQQKEKEQDRKEQKKMFEEILKEIRKE